MAEILPIRHKTLSNQSIIKSHLNKMSINMTSSQIDENPKLAENDALLKYTGRSVELCWLMAIQDPPMLLNFGPAHNEDMDTNTFRAFTRTGKKVDFVVWPAVYLYKDGPLVHKGVLEPIAL